LSLACLATSTGRHDEEERGAEIVAGRGKEEGGARADCHEARLRLLGDEEEGGRHELLTTRHHYEYSLTKRRGGGYDGDELLVLGKEDGTHRVTPSRNKPLLQIKQNKYQLFIQK
jgi:hypothetical protein